MAGVVCDDVGDTGEDEPTSVTPEFALCVDDLWVQVRADLAVEPLDVVEDGINSVSLHRHDA